MVYKKYSFFCNIFLCLFFQFIFIRTNTKPIFGILSLPEPIDDNTTFINESIDGAYINWLESAGAEVLPLHIWYTHEELKEILDQINGVLFQGSFRLLNFSSKWEINARYIFNYTLENHLPIFGICFGFRLLNIFMSKNNSCMIRMRNHGNHNIEFIENITRKSSLFSLFKDQDFESFEKNDTTVFIHRFGITPEMFYNEKNLVDNYILTSYSKDLDGVKFIDSIENDKLHIYGTQFHPEKTPFLRMKKYKRNHENDSLRRSQLLAMKVVDYGRNYNPKKRIVDLEKFKEKYHVISTFVGNHFKYIYDKELNMFYFAKQYYE